MLRRRQQVMSKTIPRPSETRAMKILLQINKKFLAKWVQKLTCWALKAAIVVPIHRLWLQRHNSKPFRSYKTLALMIKAKMSQWRWAFRRRSISARRSCSPISYRQTDCRTSNRLSSDPRGRFTDRKSRFRKSHRWLRWGEVTNSRRPSRRRRRQTWRPRKKGFFLIISRTHSWSRAIISQQLCLTSRRDWKIHPKSSSFWTIRKISPRWRQGREQQQNMDFSKTQNHIKPGIFRAKFRPRHVLVLVQAAHGLIF